MLRSFNLISLTGVIKSAKSDRWAGREWIFTIQMWKVSFCIYVNTSVEGLMFMQPLVMNICRLHYFRRYFCLSSY